MQIELNIVVLARSEETGAQLLGTLSGVEAVSHQLKTYSGSHPLRDTLRGQRPDVVILELEGQDEELLEDIRQFVETNGHATEVFATFATMDMQLVKLLVRSGVRDVLPQPVTAQELSVAVSNSRARRQQALSSKSDKQGLINCFLRARGNAGGTLLAINVACQLASEFKKKTALVDLDIQLGTVGSNLDISSDSHIMEALLNTDRIDPVFLDALMVRHSCGIHVLPSPADLSSYEHLTPHAVSRLFSVLAQTHDHVVVNLPTYINEGVLEALRLSDPLFLVTQDTVSSVRNMKMLVERLPQLGVPLNTLQVIHNRAGGAVKDIKPAELGRIVGGAPIHRVRSDYKLAAYAENAGKPASEMSPRAGMIKDIRQITRTIVSAGTAPNSIPRGSKRSWLGRLIREE